MQALEERYDYENEDMNMTYRSEFTQSIHDTENHPQGSDFISQLTTEYLNKPFVVRALTISELFMFILDSSPFPPQ